MCFVKIQFNRGHRQFQVSLARASVVKTSIMKEEGERRSSNHPHALRYIINIRGLFWSELFFS